MVGSFEKQNKIVNNGNEISRSLNCKQNKKEIDRLERKLDKLKLIANETDEINAQIKQLEGLIKNYYNKKTEEAKIRSSEEEGVSQCLRQAFLFRFCPIY
jgi:D-Tyr-tRNAtyr deacylase